MKYTRELYGTSAGIAAIERSDCSVRAFHVAAAVPYETAHALYRLHGRISRRPTPFDVTCAVLEHHRPGIKHKYYPYSERPTLAQFVRMHPQGRYIVHVYRHALAVVDGVVHNWSAQSRSRVKIVWRLDT